MYAVTIIPLFLRWGTSLIISLPKYKCWNLFNFSLIDNFGAILGVYPTLHLILFLPFYPRPWGIKTNTSLSLKIVFRFSRSYSLCWKRRRMYTVSGNRRRSGWRKYIKNKCSTRIGITWTSFWTHKRYVNYCELLWITWNKKLNLAFKLFQTKRDITVPLKILGSMYRQDTVCCYLHYGIWRLAIYQEPPFLWGGE